MRLAVPMSISGPIKIRHPHQRPADSKLQGTGTSIFCSENFSRIPPQVRLCFRSYISWRVSLQFARYKDLRWIAPGVFSSVGIHYETTSTLRSHVRVINCLVWQDKQSSSRGRGWVESENVSIFSFSSVKYLLEEIIPISNFQSFSLTFFEERWYLQLISSADGRLDVICCISIKYNQPDCQLSLPCRLD